MQNFTIKRGDSRPKLQHRIDVLPDDLFGATVAAHFRTAAGEVLPLAGTAQIVIDATRAVLEYAWHAADTAVAGAHYLEFEVTWPDGSVQTFPTVGAIAVKIAEDIRLPPGPAVAPMITSQPAVTEVDGGATIAFTYVPPVVAGSAPMTITRVLTLGGVDVTGAMSGNTYVATKTGATQALVMTYTASNGVAPPATSTVSRTVPVAPVVNVAPSITTPANASEVDGGATITYTFVPPVVAGNPTPTVTRVLTLGGVNVTGAMSGNTYVATKTGATQALVMTYTASNGVSPNAISTVSRTVPVAPVVNVAPSITTPASASEVDGGATITYTFTPPVVAGNPTPTVTRVLTLGGVDVTGAMSGNAYVATKTGATQALVMTYTASNGVSPNATGTVSRTVPVAPAVVPFQAVNADGFSATYGSTPPTYDPDNSPVFFTVTRQGFDATGGATTLSQNLLVTRREQQLPPNFASLSSDQVVLSDYVYSGDTVLGATNNSTEVSPKPVAQSVRADRRNVGNTLPKEWLEVVAAHRDGIACVEWTISNAGGSVTVRSSNIMVSDFPGDKYAVLCYRPAADVDITALTDNSPVTVNIKVYPRFGVASSVLDSSAQTDLWTFRDRIFHKRTAPPFYVYVGPTGNDGTGVISTNDMTARANPYLTFGAANLALRNRAAPNDNVDFCVMRIMEGSATTWSNGTSSPRRIQNGASSEFVIEADPLAATTPTLTFATSAVSFHMEREPANLAGWCQARVRNLRIERTGAGVIQNNAATVRRLHLVWENCEWAFGANTNNLYNSDLLQVSTEGLTTNFTGSSTHWNISGTTIQHWLLRGVSSRAGIISGWSIHGCDFHNAGTMGVSCEYISGGISGSMITSSRFEDIHETRGLVNFANATVVGWLFVNNIVEYPFANSVRILRLSGDGNTGNTTHCMIWHNTIPGSNTNGSCNLFYDETNPSVNVDYPAIVYRTHKFHSVVGTIFSQMATKGAAFVNNALHNGNAAFVYGVGCRGNFFMDRGTDDSTQFTFRQQCRGRLSKNGPTVPPSLKPGFVTPGHVDDNVAGSGNGNYPLIGGANAKAMVENSPWPFDVTGAARGTLASAGAYE
jgi:hypothetical protein